MLKMKKQILEWAKEKGILDNATPETQMLKTVEEVGELASALSIRDMIEVQDAIGDITVTLVIQAELNGLDFDECVKSAYNVIKGRTGKMENGVFVKDDFIKRIQFELSKRVSTVENGEVKIGEI